MQAKLDVPGLVRFVTVCVVCRREQREIARQAYQPAPRLYAGPDLAWLDGAPSPAIDPPPALGVLAGRAV